MKIILFTFDDAYFVPMLNRDMVRKYGDKIERVYISRDLFSVNKFLKKYNYFFKNGYPFCISIMDLVRFIKWRLIVAFGQSSVKDYFTNKGIKVSYVDNINSKSFLKELRSLEPDVVLFVPFDKIAKDEFIRALLRLNE